MSLVIAAGVASFALSVALTSASGKNEISLAADAHPAARPPQAAGHYTIDEFDLATLMAIEAQARHPRLASAALPLPGEKRESSAGLIRTAAATTGGTPARPILIPTALIPTAPADRPLLQIMPGSPLPVPALVSAVATTGATRAGPAAEPRRPDWDSARVGISALSPVEAQEPASPAAISALAGAVSLGIRQEQPRGARTVAAVRE